MDCIVPGVTKSWTWLSDFTLFADKAGNIFHPHLEFLKVVSSLRRLESCHSFSSHSKKIIILYLILYSLLKEGSKRA